MSEIKKSVAESKDYKERFEFELTVGNNIICQRYFRINNFNPTSLRSYELTDAIRKCVATIDYDLQDKTNAYLEIYAPKVFKNIDEKRPKNVSVLMEKVASAADKRPINAGYAGIVANVTYGTSSTYLTIKDCVNNGDISVSYTPDPTSAQHLVSGVGGILGLSTKLTDTGAGYYSINGDSFYLVLDGCVQTRLEEEEGERSAESHHQRHKEDHHLVRSNRVARTVRVHDDASVTDVDQSRKLVLLTLLEEEHVKILGNLLLTLDREELELLTRA